MRRRQRRLRAWARHERLSIAMALATVEHHSCGPTANAAPRDQTTGTSAREGEVREQHYGLRAQKRPLPGMRPAPLSEVLPQVGLQRHTVEQRILHTPYVQILDAPVPQKVEQLVDFFKDLDIEVPAQVIDVPKISQDIIPQRSVDLVPQLVEVPTILTPTRIALGIAEQIVDIPASARGVSGSLHGFPPEQSSAQRTASQIADIPVPGRGVFLAVLKVLSQNRVRRSGLHRRSLTFQFLVLEVPAVFLVLSQNREPQLYMLLRNAFLSGLSRIFLLVVSFARDRDQQLLVPSSSPTSFLMGFITWMSTYPSLPSGSSLVTPMARLTFGHGALALRSGSRRRASELCGLV